SASSSAAPSEVVYLVSIFSRTDSNVGTPDSLYPGSLFGALGGGAGVGFGASSAMPQRYPAAEGNLVVRPVTNQVSAGIGQRKRQRLADAAARNHHHHSVDTHAEASGGWHRVLHGLQEVFVEFHRLWIAAGRQQRLLLQPTALFDRIGQLAVCGGEFDTPRDQVPALGQPRFTAVRAAERRHRCREVLVEGGLLGVFLDQPFVELEDH